MTHLVVRWQVEQGPTKIAKDNLTRYSVWHVKDFANPEGPSMKMVMFGRGRTYAEENSERFCTGDVIYISRAMFNFPVRCLPPH